MSKRKISILILVLLMVALVALTFVSCQKKEMEITAFDYTTVYDGEAHAVEVSCSIGDTSGWTISYVNEKGESTSSPVNGVPPAFTGSGIRARSLPAKRTFPLPASSR